MARKRRDASEVESWLALRDEEGLTLRELSERSGIPTGTLGFWAHKRQRAGRRGGFVEARVGESWNLMGDRDAGHVILRLTSGNVIELRGQLAAQVVARLLERVTQWC